VAGGEKVNERITSYTIAIVFPPLTIVVLVEQNAIALIHCVRTFRVIPHHKESLTQNIPSHPSYRLQSFMETKRTITFAAVVVSLQ
jgi:hypothetical protein